MSAPSVTVLVIITGLFAAGFRLVLQRSLMRVVLGFILLGHGANLALLVAGGEGVADPLPQAMALTAIVITFGVTALLLALVFRAVRLTGDDDVPDGEDVPADEQEPEQ